MACIVFVNTINGTHDIDIISMLFNQSSFFKMLNMLPISILTAWYDKTQIHKNYSYTMFTLHFHKNNILMKM